MADKMMRMAGRGTDGTAKPVRTNNGGVVGASDLIGSKNKVVTHTSSLTPGEIVVLINTTEPWIIDDIDWLVRNETSGQLLIEIKGIPQPFINKDGTDVVTWLSANELLNNKSLLFNIVQYDTTSTPDPKFRFHLRKPIHCPDGFKISLRNTSGDKTFRNSCQVRGRVYLD